MRHGSLFSGIGGFDLASDWMGWDNVFHCEWNEFGQKVLKYYWPKAISYHDITKTDFSVHRGTIDILTGGFPCQPYSMAGKRLGKEDERHLWPEMLRAIREIQPTWVVGENVLGLVNWNGGLVFHEVQADLEAQGYEVQPYVLPAASVNAPHRRDRVWFVAYSSSNGRQKDSKFGSRPDKKNNEQFKCSYNSRSTSNSNSSTERSSRESRRIKENWGEDNLQQGKWRGETELDNRLYEFPQYASDSESTGQQTRIIGQMQEQFRGRNISMGSGQWSRFPTVSPICTRDDGLSDRLDSITFSKWRNESIKAGGNAIVPQVVHQIFKAIEQYETTRHTQGTQAQ